MTLETLGHAMVWFIILYPVATAAFWMAGGLVFRLFDEGVDLEATPARGWPKIALLIPAHNEEAVIATCVASALAVEYPALEVLVLDDGSTDATTEVARSVGAGDPRLRVLRDETNRGKADQLNRGFATVSQELVLICDADTHLHPMAPKLMVARMLQSRLNVAVAAGPHVTNRTNLLCAMQMIEAASIIGLIRRTTSLRGRVGTVAGVLALFRRESVVAVGGFRGHMATEDIDLTWRLLLAGGHTVYEPNASLVCRCPPTLRMLWAATSTLVTRTGRGAARAPAVRAAVASSQHVADRRGVQPVAVVGRHLGAVGDPPRRTAVVPAWRDLFGLGIAAAVSVALISAAQAVFALTVRARYDHTALRAFLLGPLYPLFFWLISALAALRAQVPALIRGPAESRVVWDIERGEAEAPATPQRPLIKDSHPVADWGGDGS